MPYPLPYPGLAARAQSIDDLLGSVRAIPGVSIEDDATAVIISRA